MTRKKNSNNNNVSVRAKKSLGQNFLKSQKVVEKIIATADLSEEDSVLEIGPGKGVLTESLLASGAHVIAIEKDRELVEYLQEKFAEEIETKRLILINDDALNFDPTHYSLSTTPYKLVANIPYYITGQILRHFLSGIHQPERMVLLVQKEVAERIVAKNGKESILSISVKAYGEPHYVQTVPAKLFSPSPKVDSAILVIEDISKGFFKDVDEEKFFMLVKKGFAHKRKTLVNNLSDNAEEKLGVIDIFQKFNLEHDIRAENIELSMWRKIAPNLYGKK